MIRPKAICDLQDILEMFPLVEEKVFSRYRIDPAITDLRGGKFSYLVHINNVVVPLTGLSQTNDDRIVAGAVDSTRTEILLEGDPLIYRDPFCQQLWSQLSAILKVNHPGKEIWIQSIKRWYNRDRQTHTLSVMVGIVL